MSADGARLPEGGGRHAIKLLQGYVWHPQDADVDLRAYLPEKVGDDVHVLLDAMPAAPFAFFDDGTLSATQRFYQLTVMTLREGDDDASSIVPWLAAKLQEALEATPPGVGWQVFEDLREIT